MPQTKSCSLPLYLKSLFLFLIKYLNYYWQMYFALWFWWPTMVTNRPKQDPLPPLSTTYWPCDEVHVHGNQYFSIPHTFTWNAFEGGNHIQKHKSRVPSEISWSCVSIYMYFGRVAIRSIYWWVPPEISDRVSANAPTKEKRKKVSSFLDAVRLSTVSTAGD